MAVCLPKFGANALREKFRSGEITPEKLSRMSSRERRATFERFLGEENAKMVNVGFETAILRKNQQAAMITWAEQILGKRNPQLRDSLNKVERMKEVMTEAELTKFKEDLIAKRLGLKEITREESQRLVELAKETNETFKKVAERDISDPTYARRQWDGLETKAELTERMQYGLNKAMYNDYIGSLKPGGKRVPFMEILKNKEKWVEASAMFVKTMNSTLDLSFMGNQGIISLWNPKSLKKGVNAFVTGVKVASKTLAGADASLGVRAEVFSRVNAVRGHYKRMKVATGVATEEALPSSLPERIPFVGRLFKASNDAYNVTAVKLRADLADTMIEISRKAGEDITNKAHAEALGEVVNSSTGRGGLRSFEGAAKSLNLWFYSVRLLKGAFNTLTAHAFDPKVWRDPVAKKAAIKNVTYAGATFVTVMQILEQLNPGSTDLDPRSSHFGQIRIGDSDTWFSVIGPYRPIIRTAAAVFPTLKDGEWGYWRKTAKGKWNRIEFYPNKKVAFGQYTPMDVLQNFFTGKAGPVWSAYFAHLKGSNYDGTPPTPESDLINLFAPISFGNFLQDKDDPDVENLLGNTILNFLGANVTTYDR